MHKRKVTYKEVRCYAAGKFSVKDNIWYTLYQRILN